jgi:hypothetical protein
MKRLRTFAAFWWDFIAGDDWRVAAGLALALAVTGLLAHRGVDAWWLMPAAVALLLIGSLRRATRVSASSDASRLDAPHCDSRG